MTNNNHMKQQSKSRRRRYSNNNDSESSPAVRQRRGSKNKDNNVNNNNKDSTTASTQPNETAIIPSSTAATTSPSHSTIIPSKYSQYFGLEEGEFVEAFSSVIHEISSQGDTIPAEAQQKTRFHTHQPPNISLSKYLDRIVKFAFCSAECYILSLVYMDRLVQSNPNFVISSLSIHRLLITSIMVAAKFFEDKFYNNEYYAKIGGIEKEEMNRLEIEFLYMINFSLHFQPPEFEQYKDEFIVLPALEKRKQNGCENLSSQHQEKLLMPDVNSGEVTTETCVQIEKKSRKSNKSKHTDKASVASKKKAEPIETSPSSTSSPTSSLLSQLSSFMSKVSLSVAY
ncbi:hypothetical protein C9374_014089 [Naegleria lovaniensis]|uniref:Cyclin n=1 Tax=Naegleria lovaniensis TaxID=51637 RepID=A0AA88KPV0_NAELO|nr:uncharacterized protein C9374_014089 [Naegleria lovaniensis]KAG2389529.1 hypothetical protein C9374_014089 [Naegleria lovaniensis]